MSPQTVIDLVPATLTPAGTVATVRNARIVSDAEGRVRVFVEGPNGSGVVLERELQAVAVKPAGYRQYRIETEDGQLFDVQKQGHCACGSPLKAFNPRRWTP